MGDAKPDTFVNGQKLLALIDITWDDEDLKAVEALDSAVEFCAKKSRHYLGKSELTLKIAFKPGKDGQLVIGAKLATKVPQPESLPIVLYTDRKGQLHDSDPEQVPLEFPRSAEEKGQ